MRYSLILLLIFGIALNSFSQDSRSVKALKEEADRYYQEEQFSLAIEYYRELADKNAKDAAVCYRLAECYRRIFNYPDAEAYFLKVYFLSPEQYPLALYYYALMLKFNASFDESIQYFNEFISKHQGTSALKEYVEQAIIDQSGCETAKEELVSAQLTPHTVLKLNTPYNDFAPAVRDSLTLVITSGRIVSNRQTIDERFGEAFTDNFYFEKQGTTWTDKTKQVFNVTNSRYNDGSGCFNSRGDKYYYTVCGSDGPQCKIFLTEYRNNKWSEPVVLNANINFKSFESRQPAISYGGDSLVFATNRPGGQGGFDLWISINSGGENWGPAMNLGTSVNTKLNELSPTFTAFPNVLFFSSDGHEGYGGLDLYMSKKLSTGEDILFNLGVPFNASRDDCFLSFSDHELYWSSNRQEGPGGFDVMSYKIQSVQAFISRLSLKKRNARRDINLKSKTEEAQRLNLQASRLEEKIEYEKLTDEKKKIVDLLVQSQIENVAVKRDAFKVSSAEFEMLKRIAEDRYQEIRTRKNGYLARIKTPEKGTEDLTVTGVLQDSLSGNTLASYKVMLTDQFGEVLKITRTNDEGKFKFTDVPPANQLYLRLERTVERNAIDPMVTALVVKATAVQSVVHVENIYFDFDHYRPRPEALRVLDELALHLMRHPGVQLEIFAFADDRGTNEYNLKLTQKRGQAVADYLARKGVDATGVAIIAKGKQVPREVDVELQRQYNRRVEFYLNGDSEGFKESARTFILKKQTTWKTLSEVTGITSEELKTINGALDEPIKAFQPVRIPVRAKALSSDLVYTVF